MKQRYPGFGGNPILNIYTFHLIQMCKVPFGIASGSTEDSLVPNCPFVVHSELTNLSFSVSLWCSFAPQSSSSLAQKYMLGSTNDWHIVLNWIQTIVSLLKVVTLHSTLTTPVVLYLLWKACLTHLILMRMTFCCRYIKLFGQRVPYASGSER